MLQHLIQPVFAYAPETPTTGDGQQNLCVEYGSNHLAILVFASDRSIISIEIFPLTDGVDAYTLEYILGTEKYKNETFSEVILVSTAPNNCLVPQNIFKSHLSNSIYETIHGDEDNEMVSFDEVHQWELVNVYGVDKHLYDYLKSIFPQTRTMHFISLSLVSIFKNNLEDLDALVKCYFTTNYLTIVLVKGAQLQFAQSVYYETTEDVIYQILNLFDKYHIDITDVKALVSGHIDQDAATWKELRKYLLDIDFENSAIPSDQLSENTAITSHYFTPHLHVLQCV